MYDVIMFDLDGTLTDSKIGITKSVQYALTRMGIKEKDLDKLIPFIGPPLILSFKEFYNMDGEQAKQAVHYYREYFSAAGLYENEVYLGIHEMLEQLKSQGKTLIVATSKPTVFSVQIVEHFGLREFFTAVIGSNLDGTRMKKSEVIEFALSELGAYDSSKIVMVGDRKHDILGAQKNGIDVVGVGYGYGGFDELKEANPTWMVQTVRELQNLLLSGSPKLK